MRLSKVIVELRILVWLALVYNLDDWLLVGKVSFLAPRVKNCSYFLIDGSGL